MHWVYYSYHKEIVIPTNKEKLYDFQNTPNLQAKRNKELVMHILGEFLEIDQVPEMDSLDFIGQEFVHLYQGIPIKAIGKETVGNDKF